MKETFEVECAADGRWTPFPSHGGNTMPDCIRKYTTFHFAHWLGYLFICYWDIFMKKISMLEGGSTHMCGMEEIN